jgi:hypothetical protein
MGSGTCKVSVWQYSKKTENQTLKQRERRVDLQGSIQAEPHLRDINAILSSTQSVGLSRDVTLQPNPQSLGEETGDRRVSELIMWEVRREERCSMGASMNVGCPQSLECQNDSKATTLSATTATKR